MTSRAMRLTIGALVVVIGLLSHWWCRMGEPDR